MTGSADRTPVIVGVGQIAEWTDRPGYRALSPMDLAGEALARAIADAGATADLAAAIDCVAAIRQFEISSPVATAPFGTSNNPPRSIASRVRADPARAILEVVGGQGPQKLVGELATDIAEGRSDLAAIAGSEAISTMLALLAKGQTPDWSEQMDGTMEDRGYGMKGLIDRPLIQHGLGTPIAGYALLENARRAQHGMTPDGYRAAMGRLLAPFSVVAANNGYAAAPSVRTADELAAVTPRNRIVAEPYPRMTVARDQVNQGAAILIASAGKARALGVPEEHWVHIHAVTDAKEASVLQRTDLARSPAAVRSVQAALDMADVAMDGVRHIDLYSCFAIAVFNILDTFGLSAEDPRGFTLTGGLPFFGGAGNNYSAHAIAEAVGRVRADRLSFALVGANGGIMSKYATGLYAARPADWSAARWSSLPDETPQVVVADRVSGPAVIESYTIVPGKRQAVGAVVARDPAGRRLIAAAAPDDHAAMATLAQGAPFGRAIAVAPGAGGGHVFRFDPR